MTLAELIARYRTVTNDHVVPGYLTDEQATDFFNEALQQACIRARLLHENEDPDICTIAVVSGTARYALHATLFELDYVGFRADGDSRTYPVRLVSQEWLDTHVADWREREDDPRYAIQDDTGLRLIPRPNKPGVLKLEGYRLPKTPLSVADMSGVPEINAAHHLKLVDWVEFKAFSIPDSEFIDPSRSAAAEARFIRYFGMPPDADLARMTREDFPHAVEGFLP